MKFARESLVVVLPPAVLALLALIASYLFELSGLSFVAVGLALVGFAILLFFRDPHRVIPEGEQNVVAPADGRVLLSDTMEDGRKRVAIFMSVFNVHVNRCPISGRVEQVTSTPGAYFVAATENALKRNARIVVKAVSSAGPVEWWQISGLIARKISCRLKPKDTFKIGDRFGLIYFGSRMEVLLPETAHLLAKPGEQVRAGESIIARLS
ncbi:phosphatidylserine decarboxylase [bacterium]|nr:phosphatidylserine decarboxylase [bacterium]RQV99383.1 MAG: phosphatidylserine decarboxylase family protein [bacterium]